MVDHFKFFNQTNSAKSTRFNLLNTTSSVLPYFLLSQQLGCFVSSNTSYFTKCFYVSNNFWARFFLLSKLDSSSQLPIVVDGCQFTTPASTCIVYFNLTNSVDDSRITVSSSLSLSTLKLSSVAAIYHSCTWLERELSDFTNINFLGLTDTRRLLLDYFEEKRFWQTHISNDKNYNEVLYDVSISF